MYHIVRFCLLAVVAFSLSGCFTSKKELVTAANADFPFKTITYIESGSKKPTTLTRTGNRYIDTSSKEKSYIRLKKTGKNSYIGQIAGKSGDKIVYLYAIIKVSADKKTFTLSKAVAGKKDIAAAQKGHSGMSVCSDDSVCISTLEGFAKYARKSPSAKDDISTYRILAIH